MKRLGAALALMLVLGAAIVCFAPLPAGPLLGSDVASPSAGTPQAVPVGQVHLLETGEASPTFYDLHTEHPAFVQQMAQGIREQRERIAIPVALSESEASADLLLRQVELAIDAIRRDAPEIFWISLGSYHIQWSGGGERDRGTLTVVISYCLSPQEVAAMEEEMEAVMEEILSRAPSDPAEAVACFHDWIIENTVYASDLMEEQTDRQGHEYGFNIDGVFLRGSAVCEGYSKAFKLLCDKAGIPCRTVLGTAKGEEHSWNYVELEGEWYLVDTTWDDPVGEEDRLIHTHFLKGSQSRVGAQTVEELYRRDDAGYPPLASLGYGETAS